MALRGRYARTPYARKWPVNRMGIVPGRTRLIGNYGRYNNRSSTDNEVKWFDTAISFLVDATGEVPATGQLALIAQGAGENQRIGRKCVIRSIQFRAYLVFTPGASAQASDISHIYIVQDTQANGAAAVVGDVFTGNNLATALRFMDNGQRFRILKHFRHVWNPSAGVTTAFNLQAKEIDFFKKCNIPMVYNGATGAITEIQSNNIFILAGTAAQSDDLIAVNGRIRLRFVG